MKRAGQTEITVTKLNGAQRRALIDSRPLQLVVSSRHNIVYLERLGLVAAPIYSDEGRSSATLTRAGNDVRDTLGSDIAAVERIVSTPDGPGKNAVKLAEKVRRARR
jgi:hypothetical protein